MTRPARRLVEGLALPTIGLGVVIAIAPDRAELAVHVWLLVVLALVLLAFLALVRAAYPTTPSPFAAGLRPGARTAVERPASLARLERELSMAGTAAFDVHFRLRPSLVELASGLLSTRRGIDLEREPERAREALGEETWELVRPDRPQPTHRLAAGIDEPRLGRVVSALESI